MLNYDENTKLVHFVSKTTTYKIDDMRKRASAIKQRYDVDPLFHFFATLTLFHHTFPFGKIKVP